MITTKNIRESHPITDLTSPFTLNGDGFRIKVTKKTSDEADTLSVTGKLLGSDTAVTTLIKTEQWSDELFKELSVAVITNHNIEWGVEEATNYTIKFNIDGGKFIDSDNRITDSFNHNVTWGTKATEPTIEPTKDNHTFADWYLVKDDGTLESTAFDFDTLIYANTTLKAVYKENLIVSFTSNGGTGTAPIQVLEGEKVTEPTDPTRVGYEFVQWELDGVAFDFDTAITKNITLVGKWIAEYVVTFNSDGGSEVESQTINNGSTASEPTAPTKEGFEFNGWYNGETLFNFTTPITANITLTANWLEVFTVTFDSQGGSAITAQEVTDGDVATEPTPAPTKADNTFQHWSLTETGEAYSFATEVTDDITLYAIWLAN